MYKSLFIVALICFTSVIATDTDEVKAPIFSLPDFTEYPQPTGNQFHDEDSFTSIERDLEQLRMRNEHSKKQLENGYEHDKVVDSNVQRKRKEMDTDSTMSEQVPNDKKPRFISHIGLEKDKDENTGDEIDLNCDPSCTGLLSCSGLNSGSGCGSCTGTSSCRGGNSGQGSKSCLRPGSCLGRESGSGRGSCIANRSCEGPNSGGGEKSCSGYKSCAGVNSGSGFNSCSGYMSCRGRNSGSKHNSCSGLLSCLGENSNDN